jgi:hypothetical protein
VQSNKPAVKFILVLFFLFGTASTFAFPVGVNAVSDTNKIRIGEQFKLNLSATVAPGTKVNFPLLTDTFNHFEIVSKSTIDTLSSPEKKEITLQQQLTITNFDSGFYVIPPFMFVITENKTAPDTLFTEAMLMEVVTIAVDTTKEIKANKNIIDVPFPWQDYLIYLLIALVVGFAAYYLYKRFAKKEPVFKAPVIPQRPAHEIALEELKRIELEKLWQQGFTKKYFSEITEALRMYIERRFSVYAMEQTTDEILHQFENNLIRDAEREKLKFILRHADMVKFAKANSLPAENENTMQYAVDFINNTRPVIKEDLEKKEEKQ